MYAQPLALSLCLALATPVLSAPVPKDPPRGGPTVVLQFKPIDELIADLLHVHKKLGDLSPLGKTLDDLKKLDQEIANELGASWRKGIDTKRPWGFYMTLQGELEKNHPVFLVPVGDEKEFVKIIEVSQSVNLEPTNGLYEFTFHFIFSKFQVYFRIHNGYAWFATERDLLVPAKLPQPRDVMLPEETAVAALRFYIEGVPIELKKKLTEMLDALAQVPHYGIGMSEMFALTLTGTSGPEELVARLKQIADEGKWASLRLEFSQKTDELSLEFNLIGKKDSKLAKEIAATKPEPSRMAALAGPDSAVVFSQNVAHFGGIRVEEGPLAKGIAEMLHDLLEVNADPEKVLPVAKALLAAVRAERSDMAVVLHGPAKDGKFSIVAGARIKHGALLEKAITAFVKGMPEKERRRIKLNESKLGEINVHRLELKWPEPEIAEHLFGSGDAEVIIRDDAVFLALGPNRKLTLKQALEATAKTGGPQVLIEAEPYRIAELVRHESDAFAKDLRSAFKEGEKVRLLTGTIEGGPALRVTYRTELVKVMRFIAILH